MIESLVFLVALLGMIVGTSELENVPALASWGVFVGLCWVWVKVKASQWEKAMAEFNDWVFVKAGCRAPCCPSMRNHQHS